MIKLLILTVLAGIAITIARSYNIGLEDVKNFVLPNLKKTAEAKLN